MKYTIITLILLILSVGTIETKAQISKYKTTKTSSKIVNQNINKNSKQPKIEKDSPVLKELENNMIYINGGSFIMGGNTGDALPQHKVTLSSFYMCKYEVTQKLWYAIMGYNPSRNKGDNYPVECVTWYDCQKFIERLNDVTGRKYRLPTEAEWEYAACGGEDDYFSKKMSDSNIRNSNDVAWYRDNADFQTHPIGGKLPNKFGLYDMLGNVQEWCQDIYSPYTSTEQTNPLCTSAQYDNRVIRGGNCCTWAYDLSTFHRNSWYREFCEFTTGFRLVRF